jgi:hypothetical protein
MEFVVSSLTTPVVGEAAVGALPVATTTTDPQGDISTVGPEPVVNLSNALFISPTADDANPVTFAMPGMAAGTYLLQLVTLPTAYAAVLVVSG